MNNILKINQLAHDLFDLIASGKKADKCTAFTVISSQNTDVITQLLISINIIDRPEKNWLVEKLEMVLNNKIYKS